MINKQCEKCKTPFPYKKHPSIRTRFCSKKCWTSCHCRPYQERFWQFVHKTNKCWNWVGAKDTNGYGRFVAPPGIAGTGRVAMAHRISWVIHHGSIPTGLSVLHKCDNPPCVNPQHLFSGTLKDNSQDMLHKGRAAVGMRHALTKIDTKAVKEIRRLHKLRVPLKTIAKKYSIHPVYVCHIVKGRYRKYG